jgi:hypothetical protein
MTVDPEFEELIAGFSEQTKDYIHSMLDTVADTYEVYIKQLVAVVRRETIDECRQNSSN